MASSCLYFAYGSNMNPARVFKRGLDLTGPPIAGTLHNFELRFNKRSRLNPAAGHANIVHAFGSSVEGVLYPLQDEAEIEKMDPFESAPTHYRRELVLVETANSVVLTWTYIANATVIDESLIPPRWYLDHLLEGRNFLSDSYVHLLESVVTLPDSNSEPE